MAALSALGPTSDPQHPQMDELGAVGSQQGAAELLSSKLELLKADLVNVQQQLQQQRRREDGCRMQQQASGVTPWQTAAEARMVPPNRVCAQTSDPQPERPLASRLQRSSSFQEIFSSPRNKLLRQSSLQQQKVTNAVFNVASECCLFVFIVCFFFVLVCVAVMFKTVMFPLYECVVALFHQGVLFHCPTPPGLKRCHDARAQLAEICFGMLK